MITFEIAGQAYVTHFSHFTKREELPEGCAGTTECVVTKLDDGTPVAFAEAKARKPDNFCRSLGRQISFGRALVGMTTDRAERKSLMRKVA